MYMLTIVIQSFTVLIFSSKHIFLKKVATELVGQDAGAAEGIVYVVTGTKLGKPISDVK